MKERTTAAAAAFEAMDNCEIGRQYLEGSRRECNAALQNEWVVVEAVTKLHELSERCRKWPSKDGRLCSGPYNNTDVISVFLVLVRRVTRWGLQILV